MKHMKKFLSVLLSIAMVITSVSVCFSCFAMTADDKDNVKELVEAAAASAATQSSSGDAWNYTGTNSVAVWDAAEAVYDYVTTYLAAEVGLEIGNDGKDYSGGSKELAAQTINYLGLSGNADAVKLINNLLNPAGTTLYKYKDADSFTLDKKIKSFFNFSSTINVGDDKTNDTSNDQYPSASDAEKKVIVNLNVNEYLMSIDSLDEIDDDIGFPTKLTCTYNNTVVRKAYASRKVSGPGSKTLYCDVYVWHYISATSKTPGAYNKTAKGELLDAKDYFEDLMETEKATFLNDYDLAGLLALQTTATNKYNALVSTYTIDVIKKYVGDVSDFLKNLNEAINDLYAAADNMRNMIEYIPQFPTAELPEITTANVGDVNITAYKDLYAQANAAYNAVKDIPDTTIESVKSADPTLATFTKEASAAWLAELNESICLYDAIQLKATIDEFVAANDEKVSDWNVGEDVITNEEVAILKDVVLGLSESFNNLTPMSRTTVFGDTTYAPLSDILSDILTLSNVRDAKTDYDENFYQYFAPKMTANIGTWTNDDIEYLYDEALEKKAAYEDTYNYYKDDEQLGETKAAAVFANIVLDGESKNFGEAIDAYIAALKSNIIARNDKQLDVVQSYAGIDHVDFNNITAVKNATDLFDSKLYKYVEEKDWLTEAAIAKHDNIQGVIDVVDDFVATGGIPFDQVHNHDGEGVFTVRPAGSRTDGEGYQIGYPNDIARDGEAEDYKVTEEKVNATIEKLDTFLTSKDFCGLVGLKNKDTEEAYDTLSDAIEAILNEKLFTNELINTVVGLIFPMLTDVLVGTANKPGLLADLGTLGVDGISTSADPDCSGVVSLTTLAPDTALGDLSLYLGGKKGTKSYHDDLEALGLALFPNLLGDQLVATGNEKYVAIGEALQTGGTNWNRIFNNEEYADENKTLQFDWGVTDYDSFCAAFGVILDAILPLAQALITGKDYSGALPDKAVYAIADSLTIKNVKVLGINLGDVTASNLKAGASATVSLTGQNIYKSVLIPAFEALGITDYTDEGYTFPTLAADATGAQMADAIFQPILELIDQVKTQPIDKVLSMIPSLMYSLSMDKVQGLINSINVPLSLKLSINTVDEGDLGRLDVSWFADLLKGTISDAIPSFGFFLNLGSMVKIKDLLGFNLSNVNALLDFVMASVGIPASLPVLNAGAFTLASNAKTGQPSQRWVTIPHYKDEEKKKDFTGFGFKAADRTILEADKADVLYMLLDYLLTVVGDTDFVKGIIDFIQSSAEEGTDPIEIPEAIYTILGNIGGNTKGALAALIELINPQEYSTWAMKWINTDKLADSDGFNTDGIPYLEYTNDWSREKAQYVLENIDNIVNAIVKMVKPDTEQTVNEMLQKLINGAFTNKNFSGFVELLVKLGYLIDNATLLDILNKAVDCDLRTWAATYGDLFPDAVKEGVTIPDTVPTITGATATGSGDSIVWSVVVDDETKTLVDKDRDTFLDLFTTVCAPLASVFSAFFSGKDITLFEEAITIKGYANYADSIGILFEILGVNEPVFDKDGKPVEKDGKIVYKLKEPYNKILTQAEYNAEKPEDAFNYLTKQLFAWLDYVLSENTVEKIIELIPRFTYFAQSNGLSTVIHNLLMPLLVIIDDIRPIIDIDINTLASTLIGDVLNSLSKSINAGDEISIDINIENILSAVTGGGTSTMDPEDKTYNIDLNNFTMMSLLRLVDTFLGTNIANSQMNYAMQLVCSQPKVIANSVIGEAYGSSVSTVDALTIAATAFVECLQAPSMTATATNGEVLFGFVQKVIEMVAPDLDIDAVEIYNAILNIINGLEISYKNPNWGYMFDTDLEEGEIVNLPPLTKDTIKYLEYDNDWSKKTAKELDESFDALVDYILGAVLKDNTIAGLINSILKDNVYTDANLKMIVEALVNAIAGFDESLRGLVNATLDTNIEKWFDLCKLNEATGKYELKESFGVDTAADKKTAFINGIKKILEPANELLAWLFFADDYKFLIGSEKDANDEFVYNDVITIAGGKGYEYGLVPILEALGCEPEKADTFKYTDAAGKVHYNVGNAVESILNAILDRVDEIAGAPAHEVLALIPNVIYFINANGLTVSLGNLLACLTGVLDQFAPVLKLALNTDDVSLGALVKQLANIDIDITDLSMDAILTLVLDNVKINDNKIVIKDEIIALIESFYIGELKQFKSANGEFAYRMQYAAEDGKSRADMITIVLSIALEIFKDNDAIFSDLLGADMYAAISKILGGLDVVYTTPDWITSDTQGNIYNQYLNNWNFATASTVEANLGAIIDFVLKEVAKQDSPVGTIIKEALEGNLYKDDVLDSVVELVVGALKGLDRSLVNTVGAVLGADVNALFAMVDDNGKCTVEWNVTNAESFATAFETALKPANRILAWLFFGGDYTFLNDSDGENLITIKGGEGYKYAIIPILEALGCEVPTGTYNKTNASTAVKDVIMAILNKVDALCTAPSTADMLDIALDLIANVVYFVSSNGVKSSVNNLLAPVAAILKELANANVNIDLSTLIKGVDLTNIGWDTIFGLIEGESIGITLKDSAKTFIKAFYMDNCEAGTSANGEANYRIALTDTTRANLITIVLAIALETVEDEANATALKKLIKNDELYNSIIALLKGAQEDFTYVDPNWNYMDGNKTSAAITLPPRTGAAYANYTKYTNNWNDATADYLAEQLDTIVNAITVALDKSGSPLGTILDAAITGGLYKDEILDTILVEVVKALAGLDKALVDTVGAVLDVNIDTWFNWCDIERDAEGKVTSVVCTKDWGINAKATNEEKKAAFVDAFTTALEPANRVLAWLFFGSDYTFLNDATGENLITIKGGEGYDYAIVPILEGLGCENVKNAAAFNGDVSAAVSYVFASICETLTKMCGEDTLSVMLNMLVNVVYFVNADGLKAVVNNLLKPVDFLLTTLEPVIGEISLVIDGIDIRNLDFRAILAIVTKYVGLYFNEKDIQFVETFYMGKVEGFDSANGRTAYRMSYSTDEPMRDMITILLSLVLETFKVDDNATKLTTWLGADAYKAIIDLLNITEAKPMTEFNWLYKEYAGTDKTFNPAVTSGRYGNAYNNTWKKEYAKYISDNLESFVDNLLCLLGLEFEGVNIEDINTFLQTVIDDNLYTQANADAILNTVRDLVSKITTLEPYGDFIVPVLKKSLGVDLTAWDNMTVTIEEGSAESFADALAAMIVPLAPLFRVLLAGENISFFYDIDGEDIIVIPGSEGYAYGIVPILEALGCKNVAAPAAFKAKLNSATPEEAAKAIIMPLFNRIAEIEEDPVNNIMDMLPAVIYFITAEEGKQSPLETSIRNIINSVDTVLGALEPLLGKADLLSLLEVNVSDIGYDMIAELITKFIGNSVDAEFVPLILDAVAELITGKVVSYDSVNGETYYTMVYANGADKSDMVTILLRLGIDFLTLGSNVKKVKEALKDKIPDEANYKAVCKLLDYVVEVARQEESKSGAMHIIYRVFYALNTGLSNTHEVYHNVNDKWKAIYKSLEQDDTSIPGALLKDLNDIFGGYFEGIITDDGIAPDGAVPFFQKLIQFFKNLANFFKNLFKR